MKRLLDLVLTLAALPLVLPLLAVLAFLIKIDSRGPVLFSQIRVGRGGTPFRILKLRTMVEDAERRGAGLYTVQDDPRFTRLGLFLRRFSLDELPQLCNVLAGHMSLVGPRPLPPSVVEQYPEDFRVILTVRPGLTGLPQVSGRTSLPRSRRLELDKRYVETHGLLLDLRILWATLRVVATGQGQVNYLEKHEVER